jgi:hypothetical protein
VRAKKALVAALSDHEDRKIVQVSTVAGCRLAKMGPISTRAPVLTDGKVAATTQSVRILMNAME